MNAPRAGQPAQPADLVDVAALVTAYYTRQPDPDDPDAAGRVRHVGPPRVEPDDGVQRGAHPGHHAGDLRVPRARRASTGRCSSAATPTRCPSRPGRTALEVLVANDVTVLVDAADGYTPTPAVSHAILRANRGRTTGAGLADGIVVTPSHNPPRDGGFKYNPPHGGPADTDATGWIAGPGQRADPRPGSTASGGCRSRGPAPRRRPTTSSAPTSTTCPPSSTSTRSATAGVRIGADPLGGASVDYWGAIAERHRLDLTVVNPLVDPTWRFMTLDWDGKIRMDCSSPHAMASLIDAAGRRTTSPPATTPTPTGTASSRPTPG